MYEQAPVAFARVVFEHLLTVTVPDADVIVVGVDTHRDTHHVAVVDHLGRHLADAQFEATTLGYQQLLGWVAGQGVVERVGVEGTGSYGAGLARFLTNAAVTVVEVDRPDRRTRRAKGKSDAIDAYAAATAALNGTASALRRVDEADDPKFATYVLGDVSAGAAHNSARWRMRLNGEVGLLASSSSRMSGLCRSGRVADRTVRRDTERDTNRELSELVGAAC